MRYFYKALLIILLLPVFSFAQSNFKPGYVVTLKGDTIRGLIDYREWSSTPTSINFKTSATDNVRKYSDQEIRYFNISGLESYVQYTGAISMDFTDVNRLPTARDTSQREATVLFKIMQKGDNVVLYSYTDDVKTRFYISEAPDYKPIPLVYRIYQNNDGIVENTYMKQLYGLANKYGVLDNNLQRDIEHMSYNSDAMLDIVSHINHISKTDNKKMNDTKGPAYNWFVGAGVNINTISSQRGTSYSQGGGVSNTSLGPQASIGTNIFVNPVTRQLQFRLEIGIADNHPKSLYTLKVDPYIPFEASFDELQISFNPQVIYNFYNAENFKIYGGVGFNLSYFNYSNSYFGSRARPNSAFEFQASEPYFFNTFDSDFLVKVGVQINKKWGIYAQYISNELLTKNSYFQFNSTVKQVGINYFW